MILLLLFYIRQLILMIAESGLFFFFFFDSCIHFSFTLIMTLGNQKYIVSKIIYKQFINVTLVSQIKGS